MPIAITYDERYVVGCVLYGLQVVYDSLPRDFFVIDHSLGNVEEVLTPGKLRVYVDWSEELVTPPLVVVGATFRRSTPLGFGYAPYTSEVEGEIMMAYERGFLTEGEVKVTSVAHSIFESRSLLHKITYIMTSPQFVYFMEYCGIIMNTNYRIEPPRTESEGDSVRYFINSISFDFRSEWEVGETISLGEVSYIENVISTIDSEFVEI